jgi:16S rRNA (cytosine1407-C5)-methyltransferase
MPFRPERYRPLVDDWHAFAACVREPLPLTVRANPARASPEEARAWLAADGLHPEPIAWSPGAFRVPADEAEAPGSLLASRAGLVHVQEEVSLLPVTLLDPRPGERVLDLCAAPGSKASQIAARMAGRGTLVANDKEWRRLAPLGRNLERTGAVNTVLTSYDAANYPRSAGLFDRVLADVPCTCEGTSRKNPEVFGWGGEEAWLEASRVQMAILRRAVRLCRPGGRIVYSTCSYAPEENEAVVDSVLHEMRGTPHEIEVAEAAVDGFRSAPGLTGWEGRRYAPELARTLRAWPHDNDTGGFFVAVLAKRGDGRAGEEEPPPEGSLAAFDTVDPEPWLAPVIERFGLPEKPFRRTRLVRGGRGVLSLVPDDLRPPAEPAASAVGLSFLHTAMRNPKLTTAAAMTFGARATRNAVELDRPALDRYLAREDQELPAGALIGVSPPGYALMRHTVEGSIACFGVGWLRPGGPEGSAGGATLRSLYPKRW